MNEILTQEQFLIQESVKYINDEWEKGLDSWFNIGEHVLDIYFDGNSVKASNKAWNKEHSFVKLCEHSELKMPRQSLSRCVQLVVQYNLYLTCSAPSKSLSKSHQTLLLPVPSDDKGETAIEIVDMSYRDARDWIKQKYPKQDNWLKVDDVWNFSVCEAGYGTEGYPGMIPAQIVKNVLYYWTNENDVVIDPMVGGGTTYDVCQEMNRKCYGLDIKPIRDIFMEWDITKGCPDNIEYANLVFLDPPYFKKKAKEYNLPEGLTTKAGFMDFARTWVAFCDNVLVDDGIVALLISDYVDYDNATESIFSYEYANLFTNYDMLYKISCPLTTEQYQAYDVNRAKQNKILLIRGRELYIMRKSLK